ncbi:Peroxiredoxin [Carpediemonas membranifera]|uniref:thioredoxin-dependent peroxiredoxin n=1 Tax=Carpediemonas membranifera TaxID=201153 RepID=A0A8J6E133_9EUKA|nr:Peroxiredoxin [Carpediemonas membranifera]|eukprot:KAG9392948.1 Peroxiredoxin [Carpediemonas membranifera]
MNTVPVISKPAPAFEATAVMPDGSFQKFSLAEQKGKYFVLVFYPMDFTFVCPTEIIAFSEAAAEFRKLGAEIAVVSTDSEFVHLAWRNTPRSEGGLGELAIPMIADTNHEISKQYGVLIPEMGVAFRGLFIIDDKGILRQITVNDLPVGRDVAETKRLLQAFQFTDKYGEVCPAGWHPGDDTINPEDKNAYFSKH